MTTQAMRQYRQMEKAIAYIRERGQRQPSLDDIAAAVHMSPGHLQRRFSQWVGISPKKFLQFLTVEQAKQLLAHEPASLAQIAHEAGLSGTGRLHDLFINIEAMTPGEFKRGGEDIQLAYRWIQSPFGPMLGAATDKGLCHLHFAGDRDAALNQLAREFPRARLREGNLPSLESVAAFFSRELERGEGIHLHLRATPFQLKVWRALLTIPQSALCSYGQLAEHLDAPGAARAVGSAIGKNPIAYLIPCHRVIQASGALGGYRWDETRKSSLIAWEANLSP